ncbi:MAG: Z1 domain-containing protein [Leptospirales bacterium]
MTFEQSLAITRVLLSNGIERTEVLKNPAIPIEFRERINATLVAEEDIILEPASFLTKRKKPTDWLNKIDRSEMYYWSKHRNYLLGQKGWSNIAVTSLDSTTDRILMQLEHPSSDEFDIRGLVVGYVQSGKTTNFTALIAKAVDVGYRLIIVLSGIDKGLRRQTQLRLNSELVGYSDGRSTAVRLPPTGKQWYQFTSEDKDGDFNVGNANNAALQGPQPILIVIKKNYKVLERLHAWLGVTPDDVKQNIPTLVIDDESDQASIDTRGTYQQEGSSIEDEYTQPTTINRQIRELLNKFKRKVYIAYTATPFANVLIPHDTFDPVAENDLYPKDFIVDLPKPNGYFGAEELFGRFDGDNEIGGLDVIRIISDHEPEILSESNILPVSLENAIQDFILAGACRSQREQNNKPSTMLIHGSHLKIKQADLDNLVKQHFYELRDEWRYQRDIKLKDLLEKRWSQDFRKVTRSIHMAKDVTFGEIEKHIGPFLESVQIRLINSDTGDILDFEKEPNLKAIIIGGNRLSRGLTIEGLLTSYFFRTTAMYDTLMQMGRWFGFRAEYEDLTRIYMPTDIAGWFNDLAQVEHELRQDIQRYEFENVTPAELGLRIARHPAMLVTNRLKQRNAKSFILEQNCSSQVYQTFKFPFENGDNLFSLLRNNIDITKSFFSEIPKPVWSKKGPMWENISTEQVLSFLIKYQIDSKVQSFPIELIIEYIERQNKVNELTDWTICTRGRNTPDSVLGEIDLGLGKMVPMISRNRQRSNPDSLGVITNPGDELIGLKQEQIDKAKEFQGRSDKRIGINPVSRIFRAPTNGLLLIYPISKFSGHEKEPAASREKMYKNPDNPQCADIISLAISFPKSDKAKSIRGEYIVGTAGWRPL